MSNSKKLILLGISVTHCLACLLSGSMGWYAQMLIACFSGIVTVTTTFLHFSKNWKLNMLVIFPAYAILIPSTILLNSFQVYPIWIFGLLICSVTFFLLRYKVNIFLSSAILSALILTGRYIVMPNNFSYLYSDPSPEKYTIQDINLLDSAHNQINLKHLKADVIVLDIWHTACRPCIEQFPELQGLSDK